MKDDLCVFAKTCLDYKCDNCDGCPKSARCENCFHMIDKDPEHHIGYCDLRRDNFNFEDVCRFHNRY